MRSMIVLLLMAVSSLSFAAGKSYQVTGAVTEVSATSVTVDKKGEKFEIAMPAGVKSSGGEIKKGAKITVYYSMTATEVEVKADKKK